MENINICIIKPNKYITLPICEKKKDIISNKINESDYENKLKYINNEKFIEETKDYIEIKNVEFNNILIDIEKFINSDKKNSNITVDIYESNEYLYQMCYVDKEHDEVKLDNINNLGSLLNNSNRAIFDNVVIIKIKTCKSNNNNNLIDITIDDIIFLIRSCDIHAGVIVNTDNSLKQIYFNDKLELVNIDNSFNTNDDNYLLDEKYEGYRHTIYNFDLNIYVRNFDTYKERELGVNDNIGKIYKMQIEGNSIIIGKYLENNLYYDIFVEDIANMLRLSHTNSKLTKDEIIDKTSENYTNRYRIIYNRLKNIN
tara:strand:+ start:642 stop:1580 length:939 start_codon:yes stop_codon:yes gene_type:complete